MRPEVGQECVVLRWRYLRRKRLKQPNSTRFSHEVAGDAPKHGRTGHDEHQNADRTDQTPGSELRPPTGPGDECPGNTQDQADLPSCEDSPAEAEQCWRVGV